MLTSNYHTNKYDECGMLVVDTIHTPFEMTNIPCNLAKGKVVQGSIPGRVTAGEHSNPLSLHYPKREVCAARLPASRDTLLSNTRAAQSSGQVSTGDFRFGVGRSSTYGRRPIPGAQCPHLSAPARVTGGHYTAQLSIHILTKHYIHALHLRWNPYGSCFGSSCLPRSTACACNRLWAVFKIDVFNALTHDLGLSQNPKPFKMQLQIRNEDVT